MGDQAGALEPLSRTDIVTLLERALQDPDRGLGGSGVVVDDQAVAYIVDRSGGDARVALNALEATVAAALATGQDKATEEIAASALQQPLIRYDKGGDAHYDAISAFIKSCGAPTPTQPCGGSPGCSRRGRTPASSPAAW